MSIACDAPRASAPSATRSRRTRTSPFRDATSSLIFDGRRLEGETRTLAEYGLPERAGDFLETTRSLSEPLLSQRNVSEDLLLALPRRAPRGCDGGRVRSTKKK